MITLKSELARHLVQEEPMQARMPKTPTTPMAV